MINKHPTQAEIAVALGITPGRVTHLKKQGMPIYSIDAAAAWKLQHVAPVAKSKTQAQHVVAATPLRENPLDRPSYESSRARREAAEAEMAERKLAELAGGLIRMDAVTRAWAEAITNCRDSMLQIPARLAPVLAAESDLVACTLILEEAIHTSLQALSSGASIPAQP